MPLRFPYTESGSAHKTRAFLLMDADWSVKGCTSKYDGTFYLTAPGTKARSGIRESLIIFNIIRSK